MPKDNRTFITVHDGLLEHPKVEELSDRAFRVLIGCWCWCSKNRSDGHINAKSWAKRGNAKARKELIDAGLAHLVDDGVEMHDYLEHQRSRAEIEQRIEHKIEAGRKGGAIGSHQRWHVAFGKFDPHCKFCVDPLAEPSAAADQQNHQTGRQNGRQTIGSTRSGASAEPSANASAKHHSATTTDTETETEEQILAATTSQRGQPAARKPDELFDALVEACRVNPAELTSSMRGSVNKALKDLRAVKATPGQVKVRAQRFRKRYESISLTPSALAKHWPALGESSERPDTGFTNHGAGW